MDAGRATFPLCRVFCRTVFCLARPRLSRLNGRPGGAGSWWSPFHRHARRRRRDVIREIFECCGLWEKPRAPALDTRHSTPVTRQAPLELRYEADPDYTPAPEEP